MRKITRDMLAAFMSRRTWNGGNTYVDGDRIYLHGNLIAQRRESGLWITLAGWPTRTTRDQLNALPGVNVYQRGGRSFICPAVVINSGYYGLRPDPGVEMTAGGWYLIGRDSLYCYVPGPSGVRFPNLAPGAPGESGPPWTVQDARNDWRADHSAALSGALSTGWSA